MAFSVHSAGHVNAVGTGLQTLEQVDRIYAAMNRASILAIS